MENETKPARFEGNYIQWVKAELAGWSAAPWSIFWFGVSFQLALFLMGQINLTTTITFVATFFGLLCTVATAKGKSINGIMGFISAFGYIYVNWTAGHYASVLDQLVFVACIDLPLMFRWRTWGEDMDAKIRRLGKKGWAGVIAAILVLWAALFPIYTALHDTQPLVDSLVLAIGATASILMLFHVGNLMQLWIVSNAINIVLWFLALRAGYSQSSLPMLVVMCAYMASALYGAFFSVWSKKYFKKINNGNTTK